MSSARQDLTQSDDQSNIGPSDLTSHDYTLDSAGSTVHLSDSDTRDFAYFPGTQDSRPAPYGSHRQYCGEPLKTVPRSGPGSVGTVPPDWQVDLELQSWNTISRFSCARKKKLDHVVLAWGFAKPTSVTERAESKSKGKGKSTPRDESELSVPLDGISFWASPALEREAFDKAKSLDELIEMRPDWTEVARLGYSESEHLTAVDKDRSAMVDDFVASHLKGIICTKACPSTHTAPQIKVIVADPNQMLPGGYKRTGKRRAREYSLRPYEGPRRYDVADDSLTSE